MAERILIVDNFLSAERQNVPSDDRVELLEGSIADDSVLERISDVFDYVFHLATYHGNQSSIVHPLADHENNLLTTLKLYEHVKGFARLQKLVYAASGCTLAPHTYDEAEAVTEDGPVPLDLDSPYQISKVVGEFYSVYYHRQHGLRALKRLPLQLENEGRATRDFIYVGDLVEGLLACADRGLPGDVYNLASGEETSIRELAELINHLTDNPAGVELLPARDWDRSGRRFGSVEKAKRELNFQASTPLEDGLQRTVDWARENLGLIEACIARHAEHLDAVGALPAAS